MGDAEDLAALAEFPHFLADFRGDLTADIGINLVKDEDRHVVLIGQGAFQGEHDAGDFAAGGDGAEGMGGFAGIRGKEELDGFKAVGGGKVESFEGNGEFGFGETEVFESGADFFGEFFCGRLTACGEFSTEFAQGFFGGGDVGIEGVAACGTAAQGGEFFGGFRVKGKNVFEGRAVFAFEGLQGVEAGFDVGEVGGAVFECGGIGLDGAGKVVGRGKGGFAGCGNGFGGGIEAGEFAGEAGEVAEAGGEGAFIRGDTGGELGAEFADAPGVGSGALAGEEDFFLPRLEGGGVYLAELMGEEVELAGGGLLAGEDGVFFLLQTEQEESGGGKIRAGRVGAGKAVKQTGLLFAGEEALVIVGAVEIHQQIAESAEEGERAGRAVDKLPAGAFGGECAFHEEAAVFAGFGPVFFEEGGKIFFGGIFKDGLDRAGLGPAANEGLVGAFAEEEGEGADDDGFSRAGLAGDGGEAREGFPRDVLDEREIANS